MMEQLEELAHKALTDNQRAIFASFLKDVSTMLDDEEDIFYRPLIMALTILLAILEDGDECN